MYEVTVTDQTHCRGLHQFLTEKKARAFIHARSPQWLSYTFARLLQPDHPYAAASFRILEEHGERHCSRYWH